ncbi:MAG: hypothetical protein WKF84_12365 [Pyrinomonadaceae bacterium]
MLTEELAEREPAAEKRSHSGQAAVVLNNPNRVNTDVEKLQAVTAADVQRVMQKYYTDNNRLIIHYLAAPDAQKARALREARNEAFFAE